MNNKPPLLAGIIAAPYTAMNQDGSLNLETIDQQASALIGDKVAGAFVCGTTGEGYSLSTAERMQVAERWRKAAPANALKVIVHAGHNSLPDAIQLARHAEAIGADAVSIAAPNYFKAGSVADLMAFCEPVAKAAASTPFYYYEIPAMTGVNLSMTEFLELGGARIPNLAGIKFSSTNLAALQECHSFNEGKYEILFGCDEMLLAAWALGIRGAVGSTYNYAAPLYHKMIDAFEKGDRSLAQALQLKSVEMVKALQPFGVLAAGKEIMSLRGIQCGPVRPPLKRLNEVQRAELLKSFREKPDFWEILQR